MITEIRHLEINQTLIAYDVHSEGSGKPPAIFVHGYSGRSTGGEFYREIISALAEEFTVYAVDTRGHGAAADQVENFTLGNVADDLAAFARELGIVGAIYIGHSFGGLVGMYSEIRHPRTFGALCLLATADAGVGEHKGNDEFNATLVTHGRDRTIMRQALLPMYIKNLALVERHVDSITLMDPRTHEQFFGEFGSLDLTGELSGIQLPVLFVNGGKDSVIPLAAQHETALAIANCKEVNFMSEGHMLPMESPTLTAREIINFYRNDLGNGNQN